MANRVSQLLGVKKPIIQASMFFLTNARLVAAVSNAGGYGILGSAAGQDHYEVNIIKNLALMKKEVEKTKKLTNNPFGLSINPQSIKKSKNDTVSGASQKGSQKSKNPDMGKLAEASANDTGENQGKFDLDKDQMTVGLLKLAQVEGIKVVMYAGILIPEWFDRFHRAGIKVMYRPTTPEPKIVKEAVQAGADAIIATGFDEGGTVPGKVVGTFSAVPMVVDAVQGQVPVIAAGGITDERTTKAAFDLGAEGIYVGTAFLASQEAPMAENIKKQMLQTNAEDMLMFRAPNSFYRSLPGKLPAKLVKMDKAGASADEIWQVAGDYDDLRQGMLFGDLSKGIASFGLGISFIHAIEPAKEIVERLYAGIPENQR